MQVAGVRKLWRKVVNLRELSDKIFQFHSFWLLCAYFFLHFFNQCLNIMLEDYESRGHVERVGVVGDWKVWWVNAFYYYFYICFIHSFYSFLFWIMIPMFSGGVRSISHMNKFCVPVLPPAYINTHFPHLFIAKWSQKCSTWQIH